MSPRHQRRDHRDRAERDRQLAAVAAAVGRAVRSGESLSVALGDAGREVADRGSWLAQGLAGIEAAVARGWRLDDALDRWGSRASDASVDLVVAACRLGHAQGGDLPAAMEAVAGSLLDRADAADEARALAAQARSSAAVLVALPVVGAAGFSLLDPAVARTLFTTVPGWCCLALGGTLDLVGARVIVALVARALR